MATHPETFRRETEKQLEQLDNTYGDLKGAATKALRPNGWTAHVSELYFYDLGRNIPEWQDLGCAVTFEATGEVSVVSIGCSMLRAYGTSTLHYEILGPGGTVVVPRDVKRLANNNYSVASASQTSAGRLFAHLLTPGVYTARLLVRTIHSNSLDWPATLSVFSASIAVRNY